jgi:hypothetical protein
MLLFRYLHSMYFILVFVLVFIIVIYLAELGKKRQQKVLATLAGLPMFKADEQYMSLKYELIAIDRHHNKICIIDSAGECAVIDFRDITSCEPIIDTVTTERSSHRLFGTKGSYMASGTLRGETQKFKKIRQAGIKISTMGTKHPYYKFFFLNKNSHGYITSSGRKALERTEYWYELIIMALREDGRGRM